MWTMELLQKLLKSVYYGIMRECSKVHFNARGYNSEFRQQGCWKQHKSGEAINTKFDGIFLKKGLHKIIRIHSVLSCKMILNDF